MLQDALPGALVSNLYLFSTSVRYVYVCTSVTVPNAQ